MTMSDESSIRRTEPLFTVIVPTFERQQLLNEAVGSILAQTIQDFECLVVDDCSPQPSQVPADPRVRLIRLPRNRGAAAARNEGIRNATGKYICFLDDDDLFVSNRLELAIDGLRRAPVAICWRSGTGVSSRRVLEGNVHDSILNDLTPHVGQTVIEHGVIPSFDESYLGAEDVEWWLRMTLNLPVTTVPAVGCEVRSHEGVRSTNGIEPRIIGSLRLLRDNHQYFDTHPQAAAFRWKRIGLMGLAAGDRHLARRAFAASLIRRPQVKTVGHMLSSFGTSSNALTKARAIEVPKEAKRSGPTS